MLLTNNDSLFQPFLCIPGRFVAEDPNGGGEASPARRPKCAGGV
jgi:hypothetical protein